MSKENIKLARIKKSCKVAGIVTRIAFIICIIGCVLAIISGIIILANRENMNATMAEAIESGHEIGVGQNIGGVNFYLAKFDPNSINFFKYMKPESSIPAWQNYLDETPYAFSIGLTLIAMSFGIGILAFALFQIYSVFDIIQKEDSPFSDKVLKKLLIALIIIDVIVALTVGFGQGAVGGLITWAVYTIMDYGRLLQTKSDETL